MLNNRAVSTIVVTITPSATPPPAPSSTPEPSSTQVPSSKEELSSTPLPPPPPSSTPEPSSATPPTSPPIPPPFSTLTTLSSPTTSLTTSPTPTSTKPAIPPPSGLPPKAILAISISIPLVIVLVAVMALVHCVLKRNRKKADEYNAQRQRDGEAQRLANADMNENLRRAGSRSAGAVNAALVRPGSEYLPNKEPRLPDVGAQRAGSAVSKMSGARSPTSGAMSPREWIVQSPNGLQTPQRTEGVEGLQPPAVQLYDPVGRRTIYLG